MRRGKVLLSWAAYTAALVLLVVAGSEIALRLAKDRFRLEAFLLVHRSMWLHFLEQPQGNPLMPPFVVFANTGIKDPRRLERIAQLTRLPRNATLRAPDFLQSPADAARSAYTVRTNSLGFRDPERSRKKPPRTFRVICLGAYVTFGHGVEDDQAFPRVLERRLNSGRGGGPRFEVWNAGGHSATAIHGLALLETELFDYEPDLLILEYGFSDKVTMADQFTPVAMRLPTRRLPGRLILRALRPFADLLTRSYLCAAVVTRIQRAHQPQNIRRWRGVTRRTIEAARQRGIPVIILDHLAMMGPPKPLFTELASEPGVRYHSVDAALRSLPPSPEQISSWRAGGGWFSEWAPFSTLKNEHGLPLLSTLSLPYGPYLVDIFHPNRWGHEAIARMLERPVRSSAAAAQGSGPRTP